MPKFNRMVEAEFAVANTNQRISLKNLPYVWDSDECRDMDFPGVMAAVNYLRGQGVEAGLNLVMVCTSPVRS